jgi:hypothetical protein
LARVCWLEIAVSPPPPVFAQNLEKIGLKGGP